MTAGGGDKKAAQETEPGDPNVDYKPFVILQLEARGCVGTATRMVKRSLILDILSR